MPVWLLPQAAAAGGDPARVAARAEPASVVARADPASAAAGGDPPALLPEQTLVIPVDGMGQTKFTMPSPKWFKGKPAKEVRDAEEKEFKKWVAEGAERPSLADTWNLMKLPVDNTSACSKNLGLRYAASSGLAQSPAPSSQLPPSGVREVAGARGV